MKITKSQLKQIIKEELCNVLEEARKVQIQRHRVPGRVAPGSAYDAVIVFEKGTTVEVLEAKKSWIKVKAEGREAWIPKNALVKAKERKFQDEEQAEMPSTRSSPAGFAAAAKG